MADLPTISVILPTRDRPGLLLAAVQSVLAQELLPTELLVIDDGDGAREMLRALGQRPSLPIQVLPGPRRGPAAARNAGLRSSRGDLVAFLDDDDLWHPRKLAWQALWFARQPHLGLLGTGCVRASSPFAGPAVAASRCGRPRRISPAALFRANRLAMSSVVARRECLQECGGFDEELPLAQDWDLWLRVAVRWPVAVLPAALTLHRLHPHQRSRDQAAMRAWEAEVMRRALAREATSPALRAVARRRLSWAHCRLGRLLLRRGEAGGAVQELRLALSLSPLHPVVWGSLARCALASPRGAGAARP